uniref:Uncharacterized protein n=1 Tax=Knipowitschia caucasica TaxID=637954 RepID=A0AAV2MRN0_KNICA
MIELSEHQWRGPELELDLDCSVINGWGRAPLIVVPDTGTRPLTKQDRAGAGCHAQSPSVGCTGHFSGEVTGDSLMTVEERAQVDTPLNKVHRVGAC